MPSLHARLICCVLCLAALACKPGISAAPGSGAGSPATELRPYDACPVKVPATTVTVLDTKDGVAMFFTTTTANAPEVRRRTSILAERVLTDPGRVPALMRQGVDVSAWESAARPMLVPLRATVDAMPDGARLVMVPLDIADLDRLRGYARAQGDRMRLGGCPSDFLLHDNRNSGAQDTSSRPASDPRG